MNENIVGFVDSQYVVTEDGRTYLFTSADDNNVVDDMMMMMMMMCPRVSS